MSDINSASELNRLIDLIYNASGPKRKIEVITTDEGFTISVDGEKHHFNTDVDSRHSGFWFLEEG